MAGNLKTNLSNSEKIYALQQLNLCEREIPHPLGVGMKANK